MKLRDLLDQVNQYPEGKYRDRILDRELMVHINEPSMGPIAMVSVVQGAPGFDWEARYFILNVEPSVIRGDNLRKSNVKKENKKTRD